MIKNEEHSVRTLLMCANTRSIYLNYFRDTREKENFECDCATKGIIYSHMRNTEYLRLDI